MGKRKPILLFLFFILVCYKTKAQDTVAHSAKDSIQTIKLITLHERVGEKIDSAEKAKYHLFPFWNKEEFLYACICKETENCYNITGVMKDKSFKTVTVTKKDLENMHYLVSYYAGDIADTTGFDTEGELLVGLGIRILFEVLECSVN